MESKPQTFDNIDNNVNNIKQPEDKNMNSKESINLTNESIPQRNDSKNSEINSINNEQADDKNSTESVIKTNEQTLRRTTSKHVKITNIEQPEAEKDTNSCKESLILLNDKENYLQNDIECKQQYFILFPDETILYVIDKIIEFFVWVKLWIGIR